MNVSYDVCAATEETIRDEALAIGQAFFAGAWQIMCIDVEVYWRRPGGEVIQWIGHVLACDNPEPPPVPPNPGTPRTSPA